MAQAGWYPDPGGQPNMFRYWDGHAWSAGLSPTPYAAPPGQSIGQAPPGPAQPGPAQAGPAQAGQAPAGQTQPGPVRSDQYGAGQYGSGQHNYGQYPWANQAAQQPPTGGNKRALGWWLGGSALAVVIIIVAVIAIRSLSSGPLKNNAEPGSKSSQQACPTQTQSPTANPNRSSDGMVQGGPVSYPRLSSPWSPPQGDDRVPFGSDVKSQTITIEQQYQRNKSWVASVLIGQLQAGDGFFTPKQGSKVVAKCIASGEFYGDNPVKRHDQKSKATKVDGHKAWYLKSHLSFHIKGLRAKGETMIVVIIKSGDTNGLYYASIPDNAKKYLPTAEKLISKLKVSS